MSRKRLQFLHRIMMGIILSMWMLFYAGFVRATDESQGSDHPPLQSEKDLLAGSPIAVAYSGFREGEHPDRGEGAVNPSDTETLEDLQILAKNANFPLIRLYDSDENSESVLRIIREHLSALKRK